MTMSIVFILHLERTRTVFLTSSIEGFQAEDGCGSIEHETETGTTIVLNLGHEEAPFGGME